MNDSDFKSRVYNVHRQRYESRDTIYFESFLHLSYVSKTDLNFVSPTGLKHNDKVCMT